MRDDKERCTCAGVSSTGVAVLKSVSVSPWVPLLEACSFPELPFAALLGNAPASCFCNTAEAYKHFSVMWPRLSLHAMTHSNVEAASHSSVTPSERY